MTLPPWVKLCERCKFRYGLESICPVCQEIAAQKHSDRQGRYLTMAIVVSVIVAWLSIFFYLLSKLPK